MWPYTHSHTHIRLLTIHTQTLRPAKKYATDSLVGTWACNGAHKWRCYSSGEDVYRHLYPHVPKKYVPPSGKVMCGVTGSNQLYSFRALRSQTSMDFPIKMQKRSSSGVNAYFAETGRNNCARRARSLGNGKIMS